MRERVQFQRIRGLVSYLTLASVLCFPQTVARGGKRVIHTYDAQRSELVALLESEKVSEKTIRLSSEDPKACEKFHRFLDDLDFEMKKAEDGPEMLAVMEEYLCSGTDEPGTGRTVVLGGVRPKVQDEDLLRAKFGVNLGGSYTAGNVNFYSANGQVDISKKWKRQAIAFAVSGEYRSHIDNFHKGLLTLDFHTLVSDNDKVGLWALVLGRHDGPKQINIGTEELIGVAANYFPFLDPENRVLMYSIGVGHRYENLVGRRPDQSEYLLNRHQGVVSQRGQFQMQVHENIKLMAQLTYQIVAMTPDRYGVFKFFNFSDYRIFARAAIEVALLKGFSLVLGANFDYLSESARPVPWDFTSTLGIRYSN